jgi:hypothetical protein
MKCKAWGSKPCCVNPERLSRTENTHRIKHLTFGLVGSLLWVKGKIAVVMGAGQTPGETIGNSLRATNVGKCSYAAEVAIAIGSTIEGSSFSGLLTRVEIGHIRMGSAGNGLIRSPGSGSSLSHRA